MFPLDYVVAGLQTSTVLVSPADRAKAKKDFKFFAELCFEDDAGNAIIQQPHHDDLQNVFSTKRRAVILYPVGFGKTTQVQMRIIWELGLDPSIRIVVIGANSDAPQKVAQAVAREITQNKKVQAVFPDLKPALGTIRVAVDTWKGSALRVAGAPSSQKDPSLASFGIDGKISGSRVDLLFADNVMNFENTSSQYQRRKIIDRFLKEAMGRLIPVTGRAYVTDTAWTKDDLPHHLMKKDNWFSVVYDATKNPHGDGVLWPDRFPPEELQVIKNDIGTIPFDLTYRNIPLSDSMGIFDAGLIDRQIGRVRWHDRYSGGGIICTGIDLATGEDASKDETVFVTVLYEAPIIKVLNVRAVRAVAGDILKHMIDIHGKFHMRAGFARFLVEDNAQQVYIEQMAKNAAILKALGANSKQIARFNIKGRTTTKNKRDPILGIQALAADIEMERLELPEHPEIISLRQEMLEWIVDPGHHTGDRLMALWIAKAGVVKPKPKVSVV